jgi:glycosyltransferase involved in cell wall biosynthesis
VRIAVLHEWAEPFGGSEKVAAQILSALPGSDLWLLKRAPGADHVLGGAFHAPWPPGLTRRLPKPGLVAASTLAWRHGRFTPQAYDLVVSSHHCQVHTAADGVTPHLCYVHSPARYAWFPDVDSRASRVLGRLVSARIRGNDLKSSRLVTSYAANSGTTAARMEAVWGRRPTAIISPPVDIVYFRPPSVRADARSYLLAVGRFVGYKNHSFAVDLAEASGHPLVLAGSGGFPTDLIDRVDRATIEVRVVRDPSDTQLRDLLSGALALIHPGVEDFGMLPVEAMACGTPVLGLNEGGLTETVESGVTGALVDGFDLDAWLVGLRTAVDTDPGIIRRHAEMFGPRDFEVALKSWILTVTGLAV